MHRANAIAAATAAIILALATATPADAGYGAIAYDQGTGRYGFSWNEATQQRAIDLAIRDCKSPKCASYPVPPRQCGALATADDPKESSAWGVSIRGDKSAAETQAVADVRAAAAEAAVAAAEKILSQSAKGDVAERLLADGIRDVKAKLN